MPVVSGSSPARRPGRTPASGRSASACSCEPPMGGAPRCLGTVVHIMCSHYVDCQARIREYRAMAEPAPSITALVDEWLAGLRSANTRAAYSADLRRFVAWCDAHHLDALRLNARELRRYRASIERSGASSSTTARRLSAVASFGGYASTRGAAEFAEVDRPQVTSTRAVA